MTHHNDTPALTLAALWERAEVARGGDETALVIRLAAASRAEPAPTAPRSISPSPSTAPARCTGRTRSTSSRTP